VTLYLVGLGLHDESELSIRACGMLKGCERVYLESYTSRFNGSMERLAEIAGKEVVPLGRGDIEERPEENVLADGEVALLVLGDPLVATTHADLMLRAKELGIEVRIVHNSSIYSAIGETGLQLYKFGRTTTIAYPEGSYFPKSPYDVIKDNRMRGLHTLCLLDIKADEGRFMTIAEAIELLERMEHEKMQNQIRDDTVFVGVARLGGDTTIRAGRAADLKAFDFGGPPHCLVICGKLHEMEGEMLALYR